MRSSRTPTWLIVTIVAALTLMACGNSTLDTTAQATTTPSKAAPADVGEAGINALTTSDGEPFSFEAVAGKPTVVWFWGPG